MGQTPGDDKTEPSLELPSLSLPGIGRRKKSKRKAGRTRTADAPAESPSEATARPVEGPGYDEPTAEIGVAPHPYSYTEPTEQIPVDAVTPLDEDAAPDATEPPRRRAKKSRSDLSLPTVPGRLAAVVTGLVVGAAGAAATYGAIAGCEAVRGVKSCGGAPGFLILVAIVVLMILLGGLLLRAFKVGDPGSTSFLAVGVVTVVVMLTLLDVIFSRSMFVVIPVLSALAYLLAHWVTTRFEDEPTGRRDWT